MYREFPEMKIWKLRLIDIGHGNGSFLLIAALTGFYTHVGGIEFVENRENMVNVFGPVIGKLEQRMATNQFAFPLTPIGLAWGNAAQVKDPLSELCWVDTYWCSDHAEFECAECKTVVYSFFWGFDRRKDIPLVWDKIRREPSVIFYIACVSGFDRRSIQKQFLQAVNVDGDTFRVVERVDEKDVSKMIPKMQGSGSCARVIMFARILESEHASSNPLDSTGVAGGGPPQLLQAGCMEETDPDSLVATLKRQHSAMSPSHDVALGDEHSSTTASVEASQVTLPVSLASLAPKQTCGRRQRSQRSNLSKYAVFNAQAGAKELKDSIESRLAQPRSVLHVHTRELDMQDWSIGSKVRGLFDSVNVFVGTVASWGQGKEFYLEVLYDDDDRLRYNGQDLLKGDIWYVREDNSVEVHDSNVLLRLLREIPQEFRCAASALAPAVVAQFREHLSSGQHHHNNGLKREIWDAMRASCTLVQGSREPKVSQWQRFLAQCQPLETGSATDSLGQGAHPAGYCSPTASCVAKLNSNQHAAGLMLAALATPNVMFSPDSAQLPESQGPTDRIGIHGERPAPDTLLAVLQHHSCLLDGNELEHARRALVLLNPGANHLDGLRVIRTEGLCPENKVWVVRAKAESKESVDLYVQVHRPGDFSRAAIFRQVDVIHMCSPKQSGENCVPFPVPHPALEKYWVGSMLLSKQLQFSVLAVAPLEENMTLAVAAAQVMFQTEGCVPAEYQQLLHELAEALIFLHDRKLSHNNLCPAAVMKRQLSERLVLSDWALSQHSNATYVQTGGEATSGGGAQRRCGVFKSVQRRADGTQRTLEVIGCGHPGFLPRKAARLEGVGASDCFAFGVMCLLPMVSKHDDGGVWQDASEGTFQAFVERVLQLHSSLRPADPLHQSGEAVLKRVAGSLDPQPCPQTTSVDRTVLFRMETMVDLLDLAYELLKGGFAMEDAFRKAWLGTYIPRSIEEDSERELLYRGYLVAARGEQKETALILVPGWGLVLYTIWDTAADKQVCLYAGSYSAREPKDARKTATSFSRRYLPAGAYAINGILNADFTLRRYADCSGAGAFVSSSREEYDKNRCGKLSSPEWRKDPIRISQDEGEPIYGFPMRARLWLPRGTHTTWNYNWAQGRGSIAMSATDIRKAMEAYAEVKAGWIKDIIEYWRGFLTVHHKSTQDDPPPSGELATLRATSACPVVIALPSLRVRSLWTLRP